MRRRPGEEFPKKERNLQKIAEQRRIRKEAIEVREALRKRLIAEGANPEDVKAAIQRARINKFKGITPERLDSISLVVPAKEGPKDLDTSEPLKNTPKLEVEAKSNNSGGSVVAERARRDTLRNLAILAAQKNFYAYVQLMGPYLIPVFRDGAHIKIVCDELQHAFETPNARLMLMLPPGSSKSVIGSILFPSWVFGREPSWQILHIAHTADFVAKFGGKIRDLMDTDEYRAIFPHTLLNDKYQARNDWETMAKGVYRAAGVGGGIAGKRGHIGICGLETNYVLLSNGTILQLKNLKEGDVILGPSGAEVVTNRVDRHHKVCYTINHEVDVSADHPFLDYDSKEWVRAEDLTLKTRLVVGEGLWTRIVKRCMKFGEVLKDVVGC